MAGFHSSNSFTVPSETNFFIELGVPSPVSKTLPRYLEVSRTAAAAAMPTVVGEMMPFRFGYCWSRPCVTWVETVASSLPYTTAASDIFGYFFSSCFMYPIQAFWLVAEAAAETMAIWPVSFSSLARMSTSLVPIAAVSAWLMNMFRQVGASES